MPSAPIRASRQHHRRSDRAVADIIAYVNHDIDDAVRAGLLQEADLPRSRVEVLGRSSSERIGRMVTDVVLQTIDGGMTEIRMSDAILDATVGLRSFLFEAVYENEIATAEFTKAAGILGGLWNKVRDEPAKYWTRPPLQRRAGCGCEGFPGRHDRPVRGLLYEQLFIPKPWVSIRPGSDLPA